MKRKKMIILPRLDDCNGDLSKKWFVYYSVIDPRTNKMKRFKDYAGLHLHKIVDNRYLAGMAKVDELKKKLLKGWSPFVDDETVIYEDQLRYKNVREIQGTLRAANTTFRLYANKFLETRTKSDQTGTIPTYQSKLRTFSEWLEAKHGEIDLSVVNNTIVLQFFKDFLIDTRKLSNKTIRCFKQIISNVFDYAIQEGKIVTNPVYDIPQGYEKDCAPRPIASFDVHRFREMISHRDPQLWMAIEFETYCFLRPGRELRLLKIRDIDFARGLVNVDRFRAKTNRERFATIPEHFLMKIRDEYKLHKCDRDFYVFGKEHKPGPESLGKNNLKNRFNKFREILNMPDEYKLYSWKHTGNSLALDNDISMYALRDQNGHSSIQMTEIYSKNKLGRISREIRDKFPDINRI